MNRSTADHAGGTGKQREGAAARSRGIVAGLAFFAAGVALSAWWFMRAPARGPGAPESAGAPALSEATRAVLQRLGSPVEIRFYSLLDASSASETVQAFSGRVDQLLTQYEQAAAGKLKVSRSQILSSASANAALADGMRPFNLDKGDGCYLGIAVVYAKQRESLSTLAPEWEQALEPDLTRAIARAVAGDAAAPVARAADTATLATVKRLIPNVDSISVDEGRRVLGEASFAGFKQEAQEMETKLKAAQARFLQAQADQSEAGQEAARKEIQQIQADQLASLRRLTAASQGQMNALQQIKAAAH
jgi:hypothetical protein